jgi:hypothetical protein
MLPVATVHASGPGAVWRRLAARLRGAGRSIGASPPRFVLAWTGGLGVVQVLALCAGLAAQGRALPHPVAAGAAAIALAVIAGLCLGVFLFARMLGAGGRLTGVAVTAGFYGLCVAGSSVPGWLPVLALWPAGVGFSLLLAGGPWGEVSPRGCARPGRASH